MSFANLFWIVDCEGFFLMGNLPAVGGIVEFCDLVGLAFCDTHRHSVHNGTMCNRDLSENIGARGEQGRVWCGVGWHRRS